MATSTQEKSEMARFKVLVSFLVLIGVCSLAATSFAKPAPKPKCGFNGDYSFFFEDPDSEIAGVGYFSVSLDAKTGCRSGVVVPGGIINCYNNNISPYGFEDFIEDGFVYLESDGEGTMEIETNSTDGICDSGDDAIELDISVVSGGKKVLFNSNGVEYVQSGTVDNAGYEYTLTGRAEKCFSGAISGSYDIRFWEPDSYIVGDCTIVVAGGYVTGGSCRCNNDGTEYLSEIETGGYNLGEGCQSSTGFLTFTVTSDEVCGDTSTIYLDFAVAEGGEELMGSCDNANSFDCAFEGWKM